MKMKYCYMLIPSLGGVKLEMCLVINEHIQFQFPFSNAAEGAN